MNNLKLEYFMKVFNEKSISAAAKKLYISPQALSKSIISLEEELGHKLFERKGTHIVPTEYAYHLMPHAKNILEEMSLINKGDIMSSSGIKTLKILASYDSLRDIPVLFYKDFHESYPDILLHFEELADFDIEEEITKGFAELALSPGPFQYNNYMTRKLFTDRFVLMINKKNKLSELPEIPSEMLHNLPLAIKGTNNALSAAQDNAFMQHNAAPYTVIEVSDSYVIAEMAKKNLAVGMLLDFVARDLVDDSVVIRPFEDKTIDKTIYLVTNSSNILSHEALVFWNYFPDWLSKHKNF